MAKGERTSSGSRRAPAQASASGGKAVSEMSPEALVDLYAQSVQSVQSAQLVSDAQANIVAETRRLGMEITPGDNRAVGLERLVGAAAATSAHSPLGTDYSEGATQLNDEKVCPG